MKRVVAMVIAGRALVVACGSNGDDFGYGSASPPTAFASSSGGSSSTSSASSSGRPSDNNPTYCSDRPYCGGRGCCPPSWRCVRDRCVAPGILCASDADCSGDRYCALDLLEPRCFRRENYCEEDSDAGPDCIHAVCGPGPDVSLTQGRATCQDVTIYVYNFGQRTLPPGAIVAVDSRFKALDAGAGDAGTDAGDAGALVTTITGTTTDGILPGEVALLKFPHETDSKATLRMRLVRDAGAATDDCYPGDDSDNVYNGCAIPK